MIPFYVDKAFLETDDFKNTYNFISGIKERRTAELTKKYPTYIVHNRAVVNESSKFIYITYNNIPFFDVICENMLHKDLSGYLEVNEFTFQLNYFCKCIFHRKIWNDQINNGRDKFLEMVWDNWQSKQRDGEFDRLKSIAFELFERCTSFEQYHKEFLLNDEYAFVTVNDIRELFDALVDLGILLERQGDLYKMYEGVEYKDIVTDSKTKLKANAISRLDELYIKAKFNVEVLPKFRTLKTKFTFVPENMELFNPVIVEFKMGNSVWFMPQFLIFYT